MHKVSDDYMLSVSMRCPHCRRLKQGCDKLFSTKTAHIVAEGCAVYDFIAEQFGILECGDSDFVES